jgi:hypothetical protein
MMDAGDEMSDALDRWQDQALTVSPFVDCIRKVHLDVMVINRHMMWQRDAQETTFVIERVGERIVVRAPMRLSDWQERHISKELNASRSMERGGKAVLHAVQVLVMLQCRTPVFMLEEDLSTRTLPGEKENVVIAEVELYENSRHKSR